MTGCDRTLLPSAWNQARSQKTTQRQRAYSVVDTYLEHEVEGGVDAVGEQQLLLHLQVQTQLVLHRLHLSRLHITHHPTCYLWSRGRDGESPARQGPSQGRCARAAPSPGRSAPPAVPSSQEPQQTTTNTDTITHNIRSDQPCGLLRLQWAPLTSAIRCFLDILLTSLDSFSTLVLPTSSCIHR
jgi:hypothetical protein